MATIGTLSKIAVAPQEKALLDTIVPWVTPVLMAGLFIALWFIGPQLNRSDLRIVTFILMWIGLTSSWNLIGGYTGYIDFGHSVFVGIGGYIAGIVMARIGILTLGADASLAAQKDLLWSFGMTLPIAFLWGALFACLFGFPTLRLKGPYFSIAMLGVLVAMREIVRNNPFNLTNGGVGISFLAPFAKPDFIFHVMLLLAALIFFVSLWFYRVQIGKMLKAIRDDEVGADTRGINTTMMKIFIFVLAGGFTAMIGATKAYWDGYISPDTIFPPTYHIEIIMMVMLGGLGRPMGPVIGAVLFYYGKTSIWAAVGEGHLLITGVLLITIMLFIPGGILSLFDPEDRGVAWMIRHWLLGEREKIFDDSADFEFLAVPEGQNATHSRREHIPAIAYHKQPVVLEGRGVTMDFGGLRAVNDVNFVVHQGEIVGLLGPNGSGKTTLFNCISGVLRPSAGNILVQNRLVTSSAPWKINHEGLARTFQRLRVYHRQTVYDNMLLARKWRGVPAWLWLTSAPPSVRDKADELLEFLKITHVRNVLAGNLSGGQQRLLEIGMTLMSDPVVVLLDEATSGVNPALVEEIKTAIKRLNQERGVTFLLVEHNMSFAMELCSRLYVLDYGCKIAEGEPEEIQSNKQVIEAYFGHDD